MLHSRPALLRPLAHCLLLLVAAPCLGESPVPHAGSAIGKALAQVGLRPADVRINPHDLGLWGGGRYSLNVLGLLRDNPWKTGPYARTISAQLLAQSADLPSLVVNAHGKLDAGVRLGLVGDPLAAERARITGLGAKALAVALSEIGASTAPEQSRNVPSVVRDAAALVLLTLPRVLRCREMGLTGPIRRLGLDPERVYGRVRDIAVENFEEGGKDDDWLSDIEQVLLVELLLDAVDWPMINSGATLLSIAVQQAHAMLTAQDANLSGSRFRLDVKTPLGIVSLSGAGGDARSEDDYLLIIDTGGDDQYGGCSANRDYSHPVSMTIDLAGDDVYENKRYEAPAFGAGVFGYSFLVDSAGNDRYDMTFCGEGFGLFGTGVLWDGAGRDTYTAFGCAQGAGSFGTGILADRAGDDRYSITKYGQGFGFTRGCGILVDVEGNDDFYANMKDHFNGGPYGANHHVHFVQGAGLGRRGDYLDGHSWAGGFGILVDGAGSDRYEADCYGQGCAYWHAIGILVDKSGDDVRYGGEYSLAGAPHFAIGVLQDDAGDDRCTVTIRQSAGHARDWSIAWYEDGAGNDVYQGTRECFADSHLNSISVFWDKAGDDTYIAYGPAFGQCEGGKTDSPRDWLPTVALFIDGGGRDRYLQLPTDGSYEATSKFVGDIKDTSKLKALTHVGNNRRWSLTRPSPDLPGYHGVGVDYEERRPTGARVPKPR